MKDRLIVALDFPSGTEALALAERLAGSVGVMKVGLELFTREGPSLVRELRARGFEVFLDLKLHDIPNTVAKAAEAAADLDVKFLTIHAGGGPAMLAAAVKAAAGRTSLLAISVLTSLDDSDLAAVGVNGGIQEQVMRLAGLAAEAGVAGLVSSPHELDALRAGPGAGLTLVTPGIRGPGDAAGDQKRAMTPRAAIAAGADYLVIGRPITQAADPVAAVAAIVADMIAGGGQGVRVV
jgi:orotidine-5'-phosphate decarboxylase